MRNIIPNWLKRMGTTKTTGLLLAAAMGGVPASALADRHDDHRDERGREVRLPDRDDHRYVERDDHRDYNWDRGHDRDDHDGGGFRLGLGFGPAAPAVRQVWVEPVYQTVTEQQWVAPVYQTVVDHVWRDGCMRTVDQQVWVPDGYGRGHYETRQVQQFVPGHYEDVSRQVLVTDGHYEMVTRQVVVTPGHYETVAYDEPAVSGFQFRIGGR